MFCETKIYFPKQSSMKSHLKIRHTIIRMFCFPKYYTFFFQIIRNVMREICFFLFVCFFLEGLKAMFSKCKVSYIRIKSQRDGNKLRDNCVPPNLIVAPNSIISRCITGFSQTHPVVPEKQPQQCNHVNLLQNPYDHLFLIYFFNSFHMT